MALFPLFVRLENRPCLVVGAGAVGEAKTESLVQAGTAVWVVAPCATPRIKEWAASGGIAWLPRKFSPADLEGKFLVVAATSSVAVNDFVFQEARSRDVLCNVVDDPPRCDFFYPAVLRRGDLQIAVSTNGKSPALAQRLRERFEREFGPEYAESVRKLGAARERLFQLRIAPARRREMLLRMARQLPLPGEK